MIASIRVPRTPPLPSPQAWFEAGLGVALGWDGATVNSVYHNSKTYLAFIDDSGNARVASYNHTTKGWTCSPTIVTGLGADIHCTPSLLVRSSDSKLLLAVSPHATAHMYTAVSTNAEDVSAWDSATDIVSTLGATSCTYANLFQLSGESGKIYLFYRQGSAPSSALYFSTSTDGGSTWTAQARLYANGATGSYWAISSDDTSRIDFVVSDGTAKSDAVASLYHFYYLGGSYYKSDGTLIGGSGSLPLAPSNLTKIYDGATSGLVRVPYDVRTNSGNPVAVWAAYNSAGSGSNEVYWYGTCSVGTWTVNQVTDTGEPNDSNFSEGGICVDATDLNRVLLSKKTSTVWQIFAYSTSNSGSTWTSTQFTTDTGAASSDVYNLRPVSPRNAVAALTAIWCFGPHYSPDGAVEAPTAQARCYPNPQSVL